MSAHRRRVWQRAAARNLQRLLSSWQPTARDAKRRQRRVLAALGEVDAALTEVIPEIPARLPRHAAMPEVQERKAA